MDNKRRFTIPIVGGSSLLVIFAVLCLTVFALLGLSTVQAGERLSQKAARAVGEKSIAMVHVKELFSLTGYVRGGCSPIGMKKAFFTTIQEEAQLYDTIAVSAGKIGSQLLLNPSDLAELTEGQFADVIK